MKMFQVLIVDNKREICNFLSEFLSLRGFRPSMATEGKEALLKVKEERPELVILDVKIPDLDGLQVLAEIKKMDKNIEVIMITPFDQEEVKERVFRLGAADYLAKPFTLQSLEESILRLFALTLPP